MTTGEAQGAGSDAGKSADASESGVARTWPFIKDGLPIAVSIVAMVVAVLSYRVSDLAYTDQHQMDLASVAADKKAYADQVSFWITSGRGGTFAVGPRDVLVRNGYIFVVESIGRTVVAQRGPQLAVRNGSRAPILNLTVWMGGNYHGQPTVLVGVNLGTIQPCAVLTDAAVLQTARTALVRHGYWAAERQPSVRTVMPWAAAETIARREQRNIDVQVQYVTFTDVNGHQWWRNSDGSLGNWWFWDTHNHLVTHRVGSNWLGWQYLNGPTDLAGRITPAGSCS